MKRLVSAIVVLLVFGSIVADSASAAGLRRSRNACDCAPGCAAEPGCAAAEPACCAAEPACAAAEPACAAAEPACAAAAPACCNSQPRRRGLLSRRSRKSGAESCTSCCSEPACSAEPCCTAQ